METRQEIKISAELQVQKPPKLSTNGTFYRIYSPEKIKFRSCESTVLNLRSVLNLRLPSFIVQSLTIENCERITSQISDELIKLELLNRNFRNTRRIKK